MARGVGLFRSPLQQAQPARLEQPGSYGTGRQPTTQTAGADQRLNRAGHDCRRRQTSADAKKSKLSWLREKLRQLGSFDKTLQVLRLEPPPNWRTVAAISTAGHFIFCLSQ